MTSTAYYREFDEVASGDFRAGRPSYGVSGYSAAGSGGVDMENLMREVQDNTQHFSTNVVSLERKMMLLNTSQDSVRVREEIIQLSKDTAQLAKITDTSLKSLSRQCQGTGQSDRLAYTRLAKAFQSSLLKFQQLQKTAADVEQELLTRARSASTPRTPDSASYRPDSREEHKAHLLENDSLGRQSQKYMVDDAAELEQREREMRQLETDILDINDIFRDLGTMVHEQGELVDNIESQVETAAVRVEGGNKQLEKAVRHKKCSRKLTCCICCILMIVLVVVIVTILILLAVFTDVFKKK